MTGHHQQRETTVGEHITLTASDGHELAAYQADGGAGARGSVVVAQEIFGVNAHVRGVVDEYARAGYHAVAPALFDRQQRGVELGYDADGVARGREIKGTASLEDADADIAAAVAHCAGRGPVAMVGFCWGGLIAWSAAAGCEGLAAAVGYYGGGIAEHLHLRPRCPVLLHFGEQDTAIPLTAVDKIRAAYPEIPVHLYPAGHGFNCDARGSYHGESAALARERSLAFLGEHL